MNADFRHSNFPPEFSPLSLHDFRIFYSSRVGIQRDSRGDFAAVTMIKEHSLPLLYLPI